MYFSVFSSDYPHQKSIDHPLVSHLFRAEVLGLFVAAYRRLFENKVYAYQAVRCPYSRNSGWLISECRQLVVSGAPVNNHLGRTTLSRLQSKKRARLPKHADLVNLYIPPFFQLREGDPQRRASKPGETVFFVCGRRIV